MKALRNFLDKVKPNFEKGGKLSAFRSVFDGFETFMFVPNTVSKSGTHIHDTIDSKRVMSFVVIALIPALLFGMYNIGYQNYLAAGTLNKASFFDLFIFGFLAVLPKIIVSYGVGLGIEFTVAQWKNEEIQEGFLVSGMLIPMIVPVECPLWIIAVATAFAVIFAKEIFGGTGYNIFNVALITRAFLFFAYPTKMSGDQVWVAKDKILGFGNQLVETKVNGEVVETISHTVDGFTGATSLGQAATNIPVVVDGVANQAIVTDAVGKTADLQDMIIGLMPGSIGETSVIAIMLGAIILLWSGVANWRTMFSVFAGGALTAFLFNKIGSTTNDVWNLNWLEHLCCGGFCFGAVFMATDPVTSPRTNCGKYIFGFMIGVVAIIIRCMNPGYPEGMMLAILLMNLFAALIDYCFVQRNINKRLKRINK